MPGKILIIGTTFKDENALITQGELLHQYLVGAGYSVKIVSKHRNIFRRLIETAWTLLCLNDFDMLVLQVYGTRSIYIEVFSVLVARIKGAKVISTLHGGAIPDFYFNKKIKNLLFNQIFKWSNQITVPSPFISHQLPIIQHKTKVVKNFLPIPVISNQVQNAIPSGIRLLWIRAYNEVYDPFKAVDVISLLIQQGHIVYMHMAGPNMGCFEAVRTYIEKKELCNNITLHKKLDQNQINQLVSESTAYLCTNRVDNAPVTFLEMMARGIPIVSTSVGGIPFLVTHKQQALLASTNSVEELAKLILTLHNDEALYFELVKKGKIFVRSFNPNNIVESWTHLLAEYDIYPNRDGQKRILFLGEKNAISIPWIEGVKQAGNFHVYVWNLTNKQDFIGFRFWLFLKRIIILRKLVKNMKPDLIIGYRITSYGFIASLFYKKYPVVIAQQGISDAYPNNSPVLFFKKIAQYYAYKNAHLIHAWGEVMLPEMLKYGVNKQKILVLPKGINPNYYPFCNQSIPRGIEAIVTRSLAPEYDHETILKATKLLIEQGINIRLHIVGDGYYKDTLLKLCKELEIEIHTKFYGRIPVSELPAILSDKNLYLSVPVTEGVSASLIEAMACGCFPIVTDLPGNAALIKHGKNGLLVPVKNHKVLADQILFWYQNQRQFKEALAQNRNLVEQQFDLNKNMQVFSRYYHNLIDHVRN